MTRKRHRQNLPEKRKTPAIQWGRITDIRVVVGVTVLVGAVLILKTYPSGIGSVVSQNPVESALSTVETDASVQPTPSTVEATALPIQPTPALLPEAQLDQLLEAGEPAFVFFHSNTCVQCVKMTEIVEQVYPDFSDSVVLVDVNVYDERNRNLLQRANIRAIPALIFVDRAGQAQGLVGVMEPEALREQLQVLAGE